MLEEARGDILKSLASESYFSSQAVPGVRFIIW